jgi:hypothetical protein
MRKRNPGRAEGLHPLYQETWTALLDELDDATEVSVADYHDSLERMIEELESRRDAAKADLDADEKRNRGDW